MQKLLCVPPPFADEAPASWLSRIALSQGITVTRLKRSLDIGPREDPDLSFHLAATWQRASELGLNTHELTVAKTLFTNLLHADLNREKFLLHDRGRPRYRFCPCCLKAQHGQRYFPVHWRFNSWRMCPDHSCLMLERCTHCRTPVLLPVDMITAGPRSGGVAYLSHCMACDKPLADSTIVPISELREPEYSSWDHALLANGRATLAAIFCGHLRMRMEERRKPLTHLSRLDRMGVLPHLPSFLERHM